MLLSLLVVLVVKFIILCVPRVVLSAALWGLPATPVRGSAGLLQPPWPPLSPPVAPLSVPAPLPYAPPGPQHNTTHRPLWPAPPLRLSRLVHTKWSLMTPHPQPRFGWALGWAPQSVPRLGGGGEHGTRALHHAALKTTAQSTHHTKS